MHNTLDRREAGIQGDLLSLENPPFHSSSGCAAISIFRLLQADSLRSHIALIGVVQLLALNGKKIVQIYKWPLRRVGEASVM